jgi:hypothetical protein
VERLEGHLAKEWYGPLRRHLRKALREARRPVRRTFLCIDSTSDADVDRSQAVIRRVAQDAGVLLRECRAGGELAELCRASPGLAN